MAAHLTWRTSGESRGPRPFNLRRDLPDVVDLVLLAFADEPERANASQEDLRTLKYLAPLIWFSSLISDQTRDFFTGYVWEESGRLVGNASVSRFGGDRARWMIGNVAVHPDYRRRGIARQLTEAAIDFARAQGGRFVILDVRSDNQSAYDLYLSLGFERFAGTTDLKLGGWHGSCAEASRGAPMDDVGGISLRFHDLGWSQWRPVYELERASIPPRTQSYCPVRQTHYQMGSAQQVLTTFANLLSRRKDYRLLGLDDERPAAYLELSVRGVRLSHRLRTVVHPDYRGRVELALAARAIDILRYHPWNSVWAEVPCDHLDMIEALKKCGFKETVTLHRLGLML